MAIYYYKGNPIVTPFSIDSNEPAFDITSVSLKTQRSSQGHQRWELTFTVQPDMDSPQDLLIDMIDEIGSSSTMIMPQFKKVDERITATGTIQPSTQYNAGASSIVLNSSSASGLLPKGAFIKFSGHDKMYIVLSDVDLTAGTANLDIYPKLRSQIDTVDTVGYGSASVFSYYRNIDSITGLTFSDGLLANPGTITLVEAL